MLTYYPRQMVAHPILLEARQISSNQILMIYDKPTILIPMKLWKVNSYVLVL